MSDIGNKELPRRAELQIGDRVVIRGVEAQSDEYDVGTIVAFTFNAARVHWDGAGEIYNESPSDLQRLVEVKP